MTERILGVPLVMHFYWPVQLVTEYDNTDVKWGPWSDVKANSWHGFTEDWRLEGIWRNPYGSLRYALEKKWLTGPNYSVWAETCRPTAKWQLFRAAQVTGYWRANGVNVIPALEWGPTVSPDDVAELYGIGGIYAVRSPKKYTEKIWCEGAAKLYEKLKPRMILHFGTSRGLNVWGDVGVKQVLRYHGKKNLLVKQKK
jgi:hypothetical protein